MESTRGIAGEDRYTESRRTGVAGEGHGEEGGES